MHEHVPEQFFTVAQRLGFRDLLAFRDVLHNADQAIQGAGCIRRMPSRRPYPTNFVVRSDDPALKTPILFRLHGFLELLFHMIPVFGMNMLNEQGVRPLSQKFPVAENIVVENASGGAKARDIQLPCADFACLKGKLESFLAFTEFLFRYFLFINVNQEYLKMRDVPVLAEYRESIQGCPKEGSILAT
nr:hypothetical protein [Desulfonatronum thiodismutans]